MTTMKNTLLLAMALFTLVLALYALTMPMTVTLEDAGLFQMVCYNNGLAHPPGYPLFSIACNTLVVFPDIWNGHLVSAFFGALTITVFFLLVRAMTQDDTLSVIAALAYAFSATFWAQAIIIEVYTLAALLVYLCWYLLYRYVNYRRERDWILAVLVFGLSLSNHWPLSLLCAPALLAVVWPQVKSLLHKLISVRFLLITGLAFAAGLSPYLYLLTRPDDVFGVYGPVTGLSEFFDYITRNAYNDDKAGATLADKIAYLGWLPLETLRQFGFPVSLLAAVGAYATFRLAPTHLAIAFVLNFLGSTFLLTLLLGFEFDRGGQSIFMAYPLIAYGSIAIWIAYCFLLFRQAHPLFGRQIVKALVGVIVVALVMQTNFPSNNRSNDRWVEDYFTLVLETLPGNAILFVEGDILAFPVGYLHYVKGLRQDVTVYNWNSLTFPNRLTPVATSRQEREKTLVQFIQASERPVFTIEPHFSPALSYGLYDEFQRTGKQEAKQLPEALHFVNRLFEAYEQGTIFRQQDLELTAFIFASFTKRYIQQQARFGTPLSADQRTQFNRLLGTFSGKMMLMEHELGRVNPNKALLIKAATTAESEIPVHITKSQRARFYLYFAKILLLGSPDTEAALMRLDQSIQQNPAIDNPAHCLRATLLADHSGGECDLPLL